MYNFMTMPTASVLTQASYLYSHMISFTLSRHVRQYDVRTDTSHLVISKVGSNTFYVTGQIKCQTYYHCYFLYVKNVELLLKIYNLL